MYLRMLEYLPQIHIYQVDERKKVEWKYTLVRKRERKKEIQHACYYVQHGHLILSRLMCVDEYKKQMAHLDLAFFIQ